MTEKKSFGEWLRKNAEKYLLEALSREGTYSFFLAKYFCPYLFKDSVGYS